VVYSQKCANVSSLLILVGGARAHFYRLFAKAIASSSCPSYDTLRLLGDSVPTKRWCHIQLKNASSLAPTVLVVTLLHYLDLHA
jgi:hypothetical protein